MNVKGDYQKFYKRYTGVKSACSKTRRRYGIIKKSPFAEPIDYTGE